MMDGYISYPVFALQNIVSNFLINNYIKCFLKTLTLLTIHEILYSHILVTVTMLLFAGDYVIMLWLSLCYYSPGHYDRS